MATPGSRTLAVSGGGQEREARIGKKSTLSPVRSSDLFGMEYVLRFMLLQAFPDPPNPSFCLSHVYWQ
jgi:hypothetical protein